MKKITTFLFILISFFSIAQTIVKNADAVTFKKLIDQKKSILIDLRTDDEIKNKGKIKGAQQINFLDKNAETIISKLDKTKSYLVYCASGGRSSDCAELMLGMGFKEVVNLEKGFADWKNKGFDIEKQ